MADSLAQSSDDPRTTHRPEILDPTDTTDAVRIAELTDSPLVTVYDAGASDTAEFERLLPGPSAELIEEPPRWVYYPWRRALVRVPGPASFERLRLDRNRYKITPAEQDRFRKMAIGVVGLSVGHVIAHTLALEGLAGSLRLADFDVLETSNLNRIPATLVDRGLNKSVAAARRIAELDPYLDIEIFPRGVDQDNVEEFVLGLDVLIEECDSLDVKVLVREAARALRIPVLMETSDRGLLDVERFDLEPARPLFHGLLGSIGSAELAGLSPEEKVPYILRIIEPALASARGAASLAEMGRTIGNLPQLGGDVTLGGATLAAAVRALGRGEPLPSGRVRIDLDEHLAALDQPAVPPAGVLPGAPELPAPPADPYEAIAYAATLAPSGGNVQPWALSLDPLGLTIEPDYTHSTAMDIEYRGTRVAIGAALFNAEVAASALGRLGDIAVDPHGTVTLFFGDTPASDLAALYPSVLARSTNRHRQPSAPLDAGEEASLRRAVEAEGCRLHLVTDRNELEPIAELLGDSDRIRFLTPHLHDDLMGELKMPGVDPILTGIDVRTMELTMSEVATLALIQRQDVMAYLREWDLGDSLRVNAKNAVLAASALAVVTVGSDAPGAYVQGGQALEHLWVEATRQGLAIQPVSPVFVFATQPEHFVTLGTERYADQLAELSATFDRQIGLEPGEYKVLVVRVHRATSPTARSIRRPLSEVLTRTPDWDEFIEREANARPGPRPAPPTRRYRPAAAR